MPIKKSIDDSSDEESSNVINNQEENQDDQDDIDAESVSQNAKDHFLQNEFVEYITKYIKTDDLIREITMKCRESVTNLKEQKEELEKYLIKYLDSAEKDSICVPGSGKITKYESVRKGAINKEIIQQSIFEQLKKENIIKDDQKGKELVEATYNLIEGKREKKVKTVLKRTLERKPKKDKKKSVVV